MTDDPRKPPQEWYTHPDMTGMRQESVSPDTDLPIDLNARWETVSSNLQRLQRDDVSTQASPLPEEGNARRDQLTRFLLGAVALSVTFIVLTIMYNQGMPFGLGMLIAAFVGGFAKGYLDG